MTSSIKQPEKTQDENQPIIMPGSDEDAGTTLETSKKPLSFWLSFIALNITVFIVSLDSTALAVAVPVRSSKKFYISRVASVKIDC